MSYQRVIPRDLFNEGNLLKCYGQLWLQLQATKDHRVEFVHDHPDDPFVILQDEDGGLTIDNIHFVVDDVFYTLYRPLNSREPWPLRVEACDEDPDFDAIPVFDGEGKLSPEFLQLIKAET